MTTSEHDRAAAIRAGELENFDLELSTKLVSKFPGLVEGEPTVIAEVCCMLASVLGTFLASVAIHGGPKAFEAAILCTNKVTRDTAERTALLTHKMLSGEVQPQREYN